MPIHATHLLSAAHNIKYTTHIYNDSNENNNNSSLTPSTRL